MLKLLQQWEKWLKSVVRDSEVYIVISAFAKSNRLIQITMKREDKKLYTSATDEEIERITGEK